MFIENDTLTDTREKIYQMLKILKYCTGSTVKSYECKYAIHVALRNKILSDELIWDGLKEVMGHGLLRGRFSGVRRELMELGVEHIELNEDSINFVGL